MPSLLPDLGKLSLHVCDNERAANSKVSIVYIRWANNTSNHNKNYYIICVIHTYGSFCLTCFIIFVAHFLIHSSTYFIVRYFKKFKKKAQLNALEFLLLTDYYTLQNTQQKYFEELNKIKILT